MSRTFEWAELLLNVAEFHLMRVELPGSVLLGLLLSFFLNLLARPGVYSALGNLSYYCEALGSLAYEIKCSLLLWQPTEGLLKEGLAREGAGRTNRREGTVGASDALAEQIES